MKKKRPTFYCRTGEHMALLPAYANIKLGWMECEKHAAYLKER